MGKAILVLGMHRSGTSALAGALARLGVELGDRLMDGTPDDNPSGFYEHRDVVAAHDAVARGFGRTWDDPRPAAADLDQPAARAALGVLLDAVITRDFAESSLWGVKDPRICRFLPAWLDLLEARDVEPHCLLILRSPDEVAASLARRDGFSNQKSAALWVDHVLGALGDSAGRPRARLSYDDLLADPTEILSRCGADLGVAWPESPESCGERLREFLRLEQRHGAESPRHASGPFQRLAEVIWNELGDATGWPDVDQIAAWRGTLAEHAAALPALAMEHATQVAEREAQRHAWETEAHIRAEVARELIGIEKRVAEEVAHVSEEVGAIPASVERVAGEVSRVAEEAGRASAETGRVAEELARVSEEVVAHSHELVKQGELLTELHRHVLELRRNARGGANGGLLARIRRAFSGDEST